MSIESEDCSDLGSEGSSVAGNDIAAVNAILATRRSWQWKSRLIAYTLPAMKKRPIRQCKRYVFYVISFLCSFAVIYVSSFVFSFLFSLL